MDYFWKKVHKVIKFNPKICLKIYIDVITELRKNAKNDFQKYFFQVNEQCRFWKSYWKCEETERYQARNNRTKKELFSVKTKLLYKKNSDNLIAIEMKIKTQIFMNKAVYLGLSILEISIIVMYDLWYDYVKPKYGEKAKLCHMDTDSFIVYIKIEVIYADITKDVETRETRFDSSKYELDDHSQKEKIRK